MKKFIVAAMIAMAMCLTGCVAESNLTDNNDYDYRFESTINEDIYMVHSYDIVVDNETGFQYLIFNTGYYQAMTQMIGADGKPIIAEGYGECDYCPECGSAVAH